MRKGKRADGQKIAGYLLLIIAMCFLNTVLIANADALTGLKGVALALPTIVCLEEATQVLEPELDADELIQLEHSVAVLQKAAESIAN